ncbi:MAG TPA: GntR family transcriptional regulator, partial [Solirubrobacterales bacterium]|nr:GntR family transcriptional regulator [Solirubrobacterales bacterium]
MDKKVQTPRPTLVDATEGALRERLSPGRAREGDRLPPEKQLAEALGVSRGTLRLALERLESNGEIVRRQGSGTFVGRVALGAAFSEGLEVLESYASLAERQGKRLSVRNLQIEQARTPGYVAEALKIRRGTRAPLIQRTLLADGEVA